MTERFKLRRKRIGASQQHQPANRVNKFLSQAIEARSVDQEKANHVNLFSLCFRDPEKERQVYIEPNHLDLVATIASYCNRN
jgi:adenylate cyclase 1